MRNSPRSHRMLTVAALALVVTASVSAQPMPFTKGGTGHPPPPLVSAAATSATNAAQVTATNAAQATATNSVQATANAIKQFLDANLPSAIAKGKFDLDVRARAEEVHESGLKTIKSTSFAPTVRTRLGYTTAPLYGFQAMVQGQNTSVIGPEGNYNAAGSNGKGSKPVIADPAVTDLDQAWLGYTYTDLLDLRGGRQHLVLDNHRFIGDADWRQNMQTFDVAT
ncbi:MAG TPA: alginate export family protein, partial [Dongiaceae bacterium]|nr:alginate export family protein [Dongiaceae bacterium]